MNEREIFALQNYPSIFKDGLLVITFAQIYSKQLVVRIVPACALLFVEHGEERVERLAIDVTVEGSALIQFKQLKAFGRKGSTKLRISGKHDLFCLVFYIYCANKFLALFVQYSTLLFEKVVGV